jgi:hypothetical protein
MTVRIVLFSYKFTSPFLLKSMIIVILGLKTGGLSRIDKNCFFGRGEYRTKPIVCQGQIGRKICRFREKGTGWWDSRDTYGPI